MHSRRDSKAALQTLHDIINLQPITKRESDETLGKIKMKEAVKYLQNKLQSQISQNKVLGDQLSNQISLRQQTMCLLKEEKDKNDKLSQHLSKANTTINQLRKKIMLKQKNNSRKQSAQIFLTKYKDIARKKHEKYITLQHKYQKMVPNSIQYERAVEERNSLFESNEKLIQHQIKYELQLRECKAKLKQINFQKDQMQAKLQQQMLISTQSNKKVKKLVQELDQIKQQALRSQSQTVRQHQQLHLTSKEKLNLEYSQKVNETKWQLNIFRDQMRRAVSKVIQEPNLRKKVEKAAVKIVQEMQEVFNKITQQVFE